MRYIILLAGLLIGYQSFSQVFSNNREKFVKEFEKAVAEYSVDETKDFYKEVLPSQLLESSEMSEQRFSQMVTTSNLILEKRLKIFPDVYYYVLSVSSMTKGKQSEESFKAWHSSVDKLLDSRNTKKFTDFIEMSGGFFTEKMIASSSNFDWYYEGGTYKFEYDKKAFINFEGGNLICRVKSNSSRNRGEKIDSIVVINTKGTYDPSIKKWEGTGGKITWEKVGLSKEETFANIRSYDVSLKKSDLRVDTATLTTPYFSSTIEGSLTERAFKIIRPEDKVFPQFNSFEKALKIEGIVEDVDYVGGFVLQGNQFLGTGTSTSPAQVTIYKVDNPFIVAKGLKVLISEDRLEVDRARASMYLESGDSIYHPGVNVNYDFEKNKVLLARGRTGIGQAPFNDSYHKLDIYAPIISWDRTGNDIEFAYEFGSSQDQRVAKFESQAYFNEQLYQEIQGMATKHPLVALYEFSYKYDEPVMPEGNAASALGMTISQAKPQLIDLSNKGFISYDTESGLVTINPKLETFVNAKSGKIDYDNIVITTDLRPLELKGYTPEQIANDPYLTKVEKMYKEKSEQRRLMKNFGFMDLSTLDLSLSAVDYVEISANDNVVVFPETSELVVKKNRDFNFNGWVNAGKIEINATAASFHYDDYKIKLMETKQSVFRVRPLKKEDGIKSIPMISSINGITGEVQINDPSNRSGRNEDFGDFPKLNSVTETKVYYNQQDVFKGVYDSTRFYYTLEPFLLDSMNTFRERSLRFEGELVSAGIFPVIKQDLKIMNDYSFGFSTKAPESGFDFYGQEAKYDNQIVLSHNGLQGVGTIEFMNATAKSLGLLTFLPDSTVGMAHFVNKPSETGVQFPPVLSDEAYITYVPKQQILKASSIPSKNLEFFGGEAELQGTAIVGLNGMVGRGTMTFETATLVSDGFKYKRWDIDADTASFSLKNDTQDLSENALAFDTDNVQSHVSFKDRKGEFNSNQGESEVNFPVNQYMCKMDKFTWFMDDYSIEMERQKDRDLAINTGVDLKGPNFFSTHPKQDSLSFRAPKAKFSIKDKTIYCKEVEYIDVADARIYPDSMLVNIRKKAKIDEFQNSTIVANYITKYHKFTEAKVQVLAKREYEASGQYAYYDADSSVTLIQMKDIRLDTAYQTVASGTIASDADFKLSPKFDYYGDVSIRASNPKLLFKGATRINHDCSQFDRNWMAFTSEIDPKNIQIPVSSQMKDLDGNPISAGIVWRDSPKNDSVTLYPTFLSALVDPNDPIVMTSSGFLQFNEDAKEFQIGSEEKLINRAAQGNFLALHTESCSMNGEGVIDLGMNYGQVDVDAVGVVNYNPTNGETSMNVTTKFTMDVDKGAFQDVAKRINEVEGLQPGDLNTTTLEQAIVEWDDVETANQFKEKYTIDGEVKRVPESMSKSMTFTGVRLSSHNKDGMNGLITTLETAVLVNINGVPVMKYVPFKAFFEQEYSEGADGDEFTYFINIPGGRDYFFNYKMIKKDGALIIKSGDMEFTEAINAIKEDKRKSKNFSYSLTNNTVYLQKFGDLFTE